MNDFRIEILYWQKRCRLAEKYIALSPCNPDITEAQHEAYEEWMDCAHYVDTDNKKQPTTSDN